MSQFPKHIFQTWKTKTLPPFFEKWSQSWKDKNPLFEYILWDDADNRMFIDMYFPSFLSIYDGYEQNIKRVDAVRYFFLYQFGGVYADMDFECLKPLDSLLTQHESADILFGSMETPQQQYKDHSIPNAIMISKPKAEFWQLVIHSLFELKNLNIPVEAHTGPVFLKHCIQLYNRPDKVKILEPHIFYPISWADDNHQKKYRMPLLKSLKEVDSEKEFPDSYAVTYWTHSW